MRGCLSLGRENTPSCDIIIFQHVPRATYHCYTQRRYRDSEILKFFVDNVLSCFKNIYSLKKIQFRICKDSYLKILFAETVWFSYSFESNIKNISNSYPVKALGQIQVKCHPLTRNTTQDFPRNFPHLCFVMTFIDVRGTHDPCRHLLPAVLNPR